jgi:hypothetical protein
MESHKLLINLVVGMLNSRFKSENIYRPRIVTNQIFKGKRIDNNHVDIYLEFVQMNNVERTVINVVADREVTVEDTKELIHIVDDLTFKAIGIIYYNSEVTLEAEKAARNKLKLIKFDFRNEVTKSLSKDLSILLPDDSVIGDPFWTVMEISEKGNNVGNYETVDNMVPLFLSFNQAQEFAQIKGGSCKVFGISQNHLKMIANIMTLQEKRFALVRPSFGSLVDMEFPHLVYAPGNDNILKWYLRGDSIV